MFSYTPYTTIITPPNVQATPSPRKALVVAVPELSVDKRGSRHIPYSARSYAATLLLRMIRLVRAAMIFLCSPPLHLRN